MAGIKWTEDEDNFLKENYEKLNKDDLLTKLINRTWDAIKLRAEKFKIKRYNNERRFIDLDVLLKDTNESYYWIGFIMADGHIHNNKRLKICLSIKDEEHLIKFKNFIKYEGELAYGNNNNRDNTTISVMDTKYIKKLCQKFDIKHNKTYNQCNIHKIKKNNLLLSLIVGFIDGDGSIRNSKNRKDFFLTIKCHKSWSNNLDYILKSIIRITGKNCNTSVKLTNCKRYSYIHMGNSVVLKKLKHEMLKLNVPYMKRKWDIINMDFESKYETKRKHLEQYIGIINNDPHMKIKNIAKLIGLSEGAIYKYKRELKK